MEKIIGIYKITNTITGDFYIGSSKNVKQRWIAHKCPSTWKRFQNKQLYQDMMKYGVDKFEFEILEEAESDKLKEKEQHFIELLKPTYNDRNANGWDIERMKKTQKEYKKSNKGKESTRKASNKYNKSDKCKESQKKYQKSDKGKESTRKASNKYNNQLCNYNGETLTLCALSSRFRRRGIDHPTLEAKKYLLGGCDD